MQKKILILYCSMVFFAMVLLMQVYSLSFSSDLTQAATTQSSYSLEVTRTRGSIYDCKGRRLTERQSSYVAALSPSVEAMELLAQTISGSQRTAVLEQLREGKPFLFPLQQPLYGEGIRLFSVYERYDSQPFAAHILGYLDYEGKGVMGIEKAFEEQLRQAGERVLLRYGVDIQQRPLEAVEPQVSGSSQPVKAGVVLTLDEEIQLITQVVARQMLDRGAVVVMDVDSGQLKGVASVPSFSPTDPAASLNREDAPFLNRAFSAYNVGSTFKLAVAAAALEQGISPSYTIDCVGGVEVAQRMVYCHYRAGHRRTDMEKALEQSCNPYFISLAQQIGGDSILTMAKHMGLGSSTELAEGFSSAAGNLPSLQQVSSPLGLANVSFGQGELLATPVQIAAMVSSIANGGYQVQPQLVLGWTEDGTVPQPEEQASRQIFSRQTAEQLQQFMIQVVEEGSGTNAKPDSGGAGGKTASAQTGAYDESGEEIVHAWFAGFYPAEEAKYAIVVLAEGMESGGTYAAPVFKRICDNLARMEPEE